MARIPILLSVGAALALSACSVLQPPAGPSESASIIKSGTPTPVGYSLSGQNEMQSVQHWDVLAREVVKGFPTENKRPIYVSPPDASMPFSKAFYGYLTTSLMIQGHNVALDPTGADRVHVSVQRVHHEHMPIKPPPGVTSVLALSAWLIDRSKMILMPAIGGAVIGEGIMALPYLRTDAFSEVVISVSLVRGNSIIARSSTGFYVDNLELAQYAPTYPEAPLLVQASSADRAAMPVKTFRVVSPAEYLQ